MIRQSWTNPNFFLLPKWAQPFGKHPRPHRDRQYPNARSGAQALYAEAPRLARGHEALQHRPDHVRHLRVEVMELCEGTGLYQIDLLNGSKERVSEAEYWVRRRGQLKLDRENAALTAAQAEEI